MIHVRRDKKKPNKFKKEALEQGYLWNDNYDMAEHRAVAMKIIGRTLRAEEHVHHCDHDKKDNDPSNLFVLSPFIHSVIHVYTRIIFNPLAKATYLWGPDMMDPNKLEAFLIAEGIPHIRLSTYKETTHG